MTNAADTAARSDRWTDPFTLPAPAEAPSRRRLLSYVGRWGRARRWLPAQAERILDVGCAFGYGSAAIAASGPPGRVVVGVERDAEHLAQARELFPWVRILEADATELPAPDGCADAVLLLDVLEHIAAPERALAEARRVLRPGGVIVVTVPYAGLTRWLDALNLYAALRRIRPSLPPPEAATESDGGPHRHYTRAQLESELAPWFVVDRSARSGLGLPELVALAMTTARVARKGRAVRWLMLAHLFVSILDYPLRAGPFSYNLAVRGLAKTEAQA